MSPESNGKTLGGTIDIRLQQGQNAKLNFRESTTEPIEGYGELASLGLYADLGIIESLDFYFNQGSMLAPSMFGLKYQFVGDSRIKAKKGNSSAAVAVGMGSRNASKSSGDADDDILSGHIKELDLDHSVKDIGLILGHRWTDSLLHYFNFFYVQQDVSGEVTNKSGSVTKADFDYDGESYLISTGLMLYLSQHFHFKIDLSHMKSNWERSNGQTSNIVNGGIGFNW